MEQSDSNQRGRGSTEGNNDGKKGKELVREHV